MAEETLGSYVVPEGGTLNQFLKAEDISEPVTYTIKSADFKELKGVKKLVLGFLETNKTMVVNKTNAKALIAAFGDVPASKLVGHKITIASVVVDFKGQRVKGLRIVYVK